MSVSVSYALLAAGVHPYPERWAESMRDMFRYMVPLHLVGWVLVEGVAIKMNGERFRLKREAVAMVLGPFVSTLLATIGLSIYGLDPRFLFFGFPATVVMMILPVMVTTYLPVWGVLFAGKLLYLRSR